MYGSIIVNGYVYPAVTQETLDVTLPHLTFLSPFSYGITEDGGLIDLADYRMVTTARRQEVASLLVLTPLGEDGMFNNELASRIFRNFEIQDRLIDNILATLKNKNLYGLDIDIEYVLPEDRELFTAFVANAARRLNGEGYLVSTALAPKTSKDQQGLLYEGHDYRGIGLVSNLVLIMTYEWGYTYGPPMAVAPVNKVRQVLDYAVTEISARKILMGVPNYGYDWMLPFEQGVSRAEKISNLEAVERAEDYGVEIQFDETAMSPHYNYFDADGREHEVWFEDARSIRAKLELVYEYKLAGISYWELTKYFPDSWEVFRDMYTPAKANVWRP